jgi:hypothetical protein
MGVWAYGRMGVSAYRRGCGVRTSVPEGRFDGSPGRSSTLGVKLTGSAAHTVPYGTDAFFGPIPGNKLPGYLHSIPSG